jgi:hypothetical protein
MSYFSIFIFLMSPEESSFLWCLCVLMKVPRNDRNQQNNTQKNIIIIHAQIFYFHLHSISECIYGVRRHKFIQKKEKKNRLDYFVKMLYLKGAVEYVIVLSLMLFLLCINLNFIRDHSISIDVVCY